MARLVKMQKRNFLERWNIQRAFRLIILHYLTEFSVGRLIG